MKLEEVVKQRELYTGEIGRHCEEQEVGMIVNQNRQKICLLHRGDFEGRAMVKMQVIKT